MATTIKTQDFNTILGKVIDATGSPIDLSLNKIMNHGTNNRIGLQGSFGAQRQASIKRQVDGELPDYLGVALIWRIVAALRIRPTQLIRRKMNMPMPTLNLTQIN